MTNKPKIEEIIVVEGKDDTPIARRFDVDTIETIGSAIDDTILDQIEHAQETRGVIVFTDPDFREKRSAKSLWKSFLMPSMPLPRSQAAPKARALGGTRHYEVERSPAKKS